MNKFFYHTVKNSKHRFLFLIALLATLALTVATQLEIFAIGMITKRGPDAFELFQTTENFITKEQYDLTWNNLDLKNNGSITKDEIISYVSTLKKKGLLDYLQHFLDDLFDITNNLNNLAIFLICVAFFQASTLFIHRYTTKLISIRISRDLRQQYFEHLQSLPMTFYQKQNSGGLSSRIVGDAALVAEALNACLVNYIQTPFTVASTLTLCFLTSWKLSLIVFFGFPTIIIPIVFLARRVKRLSKQIQQNQEKFSSVLIDFLSGIQTVKAFAMEDFSLKRYLERNHKMADLEQRSARYDLASRPIVHTIAMFFLSVALVYGLYILKMSISEVLVFCAFLYIFYEPIKKFAEENSRIQRGLAAAERIEEIMKEKPQVEEIAAPISLTSFSQNIEFEDVWFKYADNWILQGLSFSIQKGQTVAIVGPTGAGKSTIVQLLPRLYDVQKGYIRIDGKPIQEYSQKSLREFIAYVPQKPFLFLDTISQNIAFGKPYSLLEIENAARKAHAEEFIIKLKDGYDTELSEGGKNLSGGQQQRLAIARALVKSAPILVMDEATSSLDTISEHHIKTAIQKLRGEVTQIIIAHRLSTIEDADKIIYLEKGKKVAEGSKEELLLSCSGFRQMWETMNLKEKS